MWYGGGGERGALAVRRAASSSVPLQLPRVRWQLQLPGLPADALLPEVVVESATPDAGGDAGASESRYRATWVAGTS